MSLYRTATAAAALGAVALALTLVGGGPAQPARAQTVAEIDMLGDQFVAHDTTISTGTVVVWVNAENQAGGSGAVHTLVADDGSPIAPGILSPGDTFSLEYDTPGVYHYLCTLHASMDGTIVVQ